MDKLVRYVRTVKPEYAAAAAMIFGGIGMYATSRFVKMLPYEMEAPDWLRALWNCEEDQVMAAYEVAFADLLETLKDYGEVEDGSDVVSTKIG